MLVAGKGHEDYQIIKDVKHHFDDHEVVRDAMGLNPSGIQGVLSGIRNFFKL